MNSTLSKKFKKYATIKAPKHTTAYYRALKKNYLSQSGDMRAIIRKALDTELNNQ